MKTKLALVMATAILTGCGSVSQETQATTAGECPNGQGGEWPSLVDDSRPDILVIGDSISIGYTPFLRAALPAYDVVHNECNGQSSVKGVQKIDAWLGYRAHWDMITFNHGIHDEGRGGPTPPETYRANLRTIALKILARTDRPYFILTTFVPANTRHSDETLVQPYNQIAGEVMAELGIPVIDLYSVSSAMPEMYLSDGVFNDLHFKPEGYSQLADKILDTL